MEKATLRGAFSKKVLEEAKKDKDIIVVATDSRGSAQLGDFPKELPDQFVEIGIAGAKFRDGFRRNGRCGKKGIRHRTCQLLQYAFC